LACVEDTYLELSVNFDRKVLEGKAILTVVKKPSVTEIVRKYLYFLYQAKY